MNNELMLTQGGISASPGDKCRGYFPTGNLSAAETQKPKFPLPLGPIPLLLLAPSRHLLLLTHLSFLLCAKLHSCSFAFPLAQTSSCSTTAFALLSPSLSALKAPPRRLPFSRASSLAPSRRPLRNHHLSAPSVLSHQAAAWSLPSLSLSCISPSPQPPAPLPPAPACLG